MWTLFLKCRRYRRNRSFAIGCVEDQETNQPWGFQGSWVPQDCCWRRHGLVSVSKSQNFRFRMLLSDMSTYAVLVISQWLILTLFHRGAGWTAARNAPGSFALFGGSAVVKEHIFHLHDYNKATFFQNFCASIGGAVASITVAAPLDVVKTRIQNRNFENPESGMNIIKDLLRKEGVTGFFKGLTPKILVVRRIFFARVVEREKWGLA